MSISIEPMSVEEIEHFKLERLRELLLPEGDHMFVVEDAQELQSKSGNPMVKLTLRIIHDDKKFTIFDWIVCTKSWMFKLRKFCESIDMLEMYDSGKIKASSLVGKRGVAIIGCKNDKKYGWQNSVESYILEEDKNNTANNTTSEIIDDDLPF
jgi:hypothetical protein